MKSNFFIHFIYKYLILSLLIYYRARYYDPAVGRFIQRDPLGLAGGINLYAYADNNPVNFNDPSGLLAHQTGLWWDTQNETYHLTTRISGGLGAIGGGSEAFLGGAACTTGLGCVVGVPVAAHGLDQVQAGLRQLWTGQETDPLTSLGLQKAGLSRGTANQVNAVISIVGSFGAGMTTKALQEVAGLDAAGTMASEGVADGKFYSVAHEMKLNPDSYPGVTRYMHFKEANTALESAMESNPALSELGITVPKSSIGAIIGKSPTDWVWHHDIENGVMQLVPKSQHPNIPGGIFWETLHPEGKGGFSIWGK